MNSCSNIEIVNFDNLDNEDEMETPFNLEHNCESNYISNFIADRYETDASEFFLDNRSFSAFSDYGNSYSCNNSIIVDQTNFADNFKCLNLNDSLSQLENEICNSFSYKPSDSKKKLSSKNNVISLENSIDLENIEYECIGTNIILIENKQIEGNKKNLINEKTHTNKNINRNFYIQNNNLEKDIKKIQTKLYKCNQEGCSKAYKSKENLTLHYKNIHLKEKPYNCKYCTATFSHRNGKTYHERKFHTKFLPHKCTHDECEISFASKSALSYHIKSIHSNKPNRKTNRMNKSKFNEKIMQLVSQPNS